MKPRYSAADIANYFLFKAQQENQELLSNLKLQKLLYYAQGLYLVVNRKPLFKERIEAWTYGPVIPDVYHTYKKYDASGIPADKKFKLKSIDEETRDFLDEIIEAFGQFSAIRLMEISHTDQCVTDARINSEITQEAMRKHLRKYIKDE